jgi:hypothetical protein
MVHKKDTSLKTLQKIIEKRRHPIMYVGVLAYKYDKKHGGYVPAPEYNR